MKKLTTTQIQAIQTLAENPLIYSTDIEFHKDLSRIVIKSETGADWNEVNDILNSALDELFPNLAYNGLTVKEYFPIDQTDHEYYFIDWEGEAFITLIMRMKPTKVVWTTDEILRQEG